MLIVCSLFVTEPQPELFVMDLDSLALYAVGYGEDVAHGDQCSTAEINITRRRADEHLDLKVITS